MKSYSFAKVSARGILTEADYNNKYIFTEDLRNIVNLSETQRIERTRFIRERAIPVHNLPLSECGGDMGFRNLLMAVRSLLICDRFGKRSIVCCDLGVNRSRTVIEAFHYAKLGFHFEDEYKGYLNHLIYNCETGHLPPLEEVEYELRFLSDYKGGDLQYIMEMKERGIF